MLTWRTIIVHKSHSCILFQNQLSNCDFDWNPSISIFFVRFFLKCNTLCVLLCYACHTTYLQVERNREKKCNRWEKKAHKQHQQPKITFQRDIWMNTEIKSSRMTLIYNWWHFFLQIFLLTFFLWNFHFVSIWCAYLLTEWDSIQLRYHLDWSKTPYMDLIYH